MFITNDTAYNILKNNITYIDLERIILMFAYVKNIEPNLFDIEFINASDCIYEEDENAEMIIDFVENEKNQDKLFKWMVKHNETYISLDEKIYNTNW